MWPSSSIIISLVQQQHLVKSDLQLYSFSYFYFMQEWMPVQFYGGTVLYGPLEGFAILCLQHKTTRDAGLFEMLLCGTQTLIRREGHTYIHTTGLVLRLFKVKMEISGCKERKAVINEESPSPGLQKHVCIHCSPETNK